ncbi:PadR family transcriptional regulator [Streptomyces radicis]|uniref:PadR family transcriptional regulator n=1 Tax=Streptomyces radicis TaxID=1750517 RepID=A0A3A9WSD9_9ACTN|nr:helix-turn-helix transcriptional regulator [Streptomyces radicis]RKN12464.1 PadR family transcriptional regulator [Streptomyces radicis]RKN27768.1 PadR family transcriptional regulator [Streptomyces radicis]
MKADVVRGHLDGLLLAVLEEGPLHGYAIIAAVQRRSGGVLELRTGTIYPALNRLERLGLLSSSWQSVGERRRRCYALTDAGRHTLAGERTAWSEFTAAIGSVLNPAVNPAVPPPGLAP